MNAARNLLIALLACSCAMAPHVLAPSHPWGTSPWWDDPAPRAA